MPDTPAGPGGWGVLKVSAIHASGYQPEENKAVNDMSLVSPRYLIHAGDLLFSRANTPDLVGSACIATESSERLLLSDKSLRLVVNPAVADARFVCISLSSDWVRRQIVNSASGSSLSMQNVSQDAIKNLMIRWPSLGEQRRICEVVEAFADREQVISASIAKLDKLRDAVMSELGGLECGIFEGVLESGPQNGVYKPASSYGATGAPIVRIDSFKGGQSDLTRDLLRVELGKGEIERYGLNVGDIIINRVNTPELVGKSTAVRKLAEPTVFESNMMRCTLRADRADPTFVETWLGSHPAKVHFRVRAKSAISQASINASDVRSCPFPRLDVSGQLDFLRRLAAVRGQRQAEEAELSKLRELRRGIVDDLLDCGVGV
ncbi:hypothetical protein ACIOG8_02315 [Streptomyces erythrochromogenes]|uniref:restriction endonuclease subunit S n=1 Tax=Streptomyces erythrochromogenes TaxID=285574 RepID=UPI0037F60105